MSELPALMPISEVFRYLRRNRVAHIPLPLPPQSGILASEVKMLAPMIPKLTVKLLLWKPAPAAEMVLQFVDAGRQSKPIRLRLSAVVFDSTEDLVAFGFEMVKKHPLDPRVVGSIDPVDALKNGKKP